MEIVRLRLDDYPKFNGQPKYDIPAMYWQIYWFYQQYSQNYTYKIVYGDGIDISRVINFELIDLYKVYGIDFKESSDIVSERRYVATVPLNDLLNDDIFSENLSKRAYYSEPEDVGLVFVDYGERESLDEISSLQVTQIGVMLQEAFPNALVANSGLTKFDAQLSGDPAELKSAEKLDDIVSETDLFSGECFKSRREAIVRQMLGVIDSVRLHKSGLVDATSSDIADRFSISNKAAIAYICLMKYNKTVYFDRYSDVVMYGMVNETFAQNAMYADDYLHQLANLPDVAVYHAAEPILVFPDRARNRNKNVRFGVFECQIDLDTLAFGDNQINRTYDYNDIELLSAAKLFNLSSTNFNTAEEGMKRLKRLLYKFTVRCRTEIDMRSTLLNISNVIFYRIDDKTFIGYLAYVYANTHFMAYPIRQISKPFKLDLDLTKVVLRDVRMYWDWKRVLAPYAKAGMVRMNNLFFKPLRYLRGLCLLGAPIDHAPMLKSIGLTFEEIGMYSDASWGLRKSTLMLDYVKQSYIARDVATPFGGPHPISNIRININRENWRSNADKIQQFNTYGY